MKTMLNNIIKSVFAFAFFIGIGHLTFGQNIGVNTTTPDASAALDVTATDKGMLIPRLTTAQKTGIASPATGLLVYDTDLDEFWYFDGTVWTAIGGGGGGTLDDAYDFGGAGAGRSITADNGAVQVNTSINSQAAVFAQHTGVGVGFLANSSSTSNTFSTIESHTNSTAASFANPLGAVYGVNDGSGNWAVGVVGENLNSSGTDAHGVLGITGSSTSGGVYGSNPNGFGTIGDGLYGVFGETNSLSGGGVVGQVSGSLGATQAGYLGAVRSGFEYAVYADNDMLFEGLVVGDPTTGATILLDATAGSIQCVGLMAKGGGSFKIDHPMDPENKYLYHSFVESPDMKNIYDGVATLDQSGNATVTLPSYFEELNDNFRYQLSAIGAPMPNLYVSEKVNNNHFTISGGTPGAEVSWQVTGIRKDKFAEANRIVPEVEKEEYNKGRYLHPELYNSREQTYIRDPKIQSSPNDRSVREK